MKPISLFFPVINDRLRTNRGYAMCEKRFRHKQAKAKQETQSKAAVVVDLFAGVGSAVVVLKRLNIAISKIIHVEHDKVANYVYKYWNSLEGRQEDDGIEHIVIPAFETFQDNLQELLKEHGRKNSLCCMSAYVLEFRHPLTIQGFCFLNNSI